MNNLEFDMEVLGELTNVSDRDSLATFTFSNGFGFPRSYQHFVFQFGYGLALEIFHIYIPMGTYGDSLWIRSAEIKETYLDALEDDDLWFDLEPDGSIALLPRLFPFAMSDNGHYLFWDLGAYDKDKDEYDIYITDFRGAGFRKLANNLYQAIDNLCGENFKDFLPFATKPLQKQFKPIKLLQP